MRKFDAAFTRARRAEPVRPAARRGDSAGEYSQRALQRASGCCTFEELTHVGLNYVFDTGHANMGEGVEHEFDLMKERIRSTHVHDNNGKDDIHLFPLAGRGRHHRLEEDDGAAAQPRGPVSAAAGIEGDAANSPTRWRACVPGLRTLGRAVRRKTTIAMIQPDSYVRSLLKRSPGETRHRPGLGEDPPRQQERPLHPAQRRVVAGGPAGGARCRRGRRGRGRQDHHRRLHQRGGRTGGVAGQGPGGGAEGARADHPRHGGPGALSAAEEEAHAGDAARAGAPAHALQHLRRGLPGAQRAGRARSTNSSRIAASCTCTRR